MAGEVRRDHKNRILRTGESIRPGGKYQFKYHICGKPYFVYSWRLEPTDPFPKNKKPDLSLREKEKLIGYDLESQIDPLGKNIKVLELVDRYITTKTGVKRTTKVGYQYARNILAKDPIGKKKIGVIKTSDAKLFFIKMQKEEGRGFSSIATLRGLLRPAFQMAMDDNCIQKNPFAFSLSGVVVNDSVPREAATEEQMRRFLQFIHDDYIYYRYYDAVYILFHTGMRISEFCGLTVSDIDLIAKTVNIDHQLQRYSDMSYHIETTKTSAGKRKIPITDEVAECFERILEERGSAWTAEPPIDGCRGFLFVDEKGMPLVSQHWQSRFKHMMERYNSIYKVQMPKITPHVCRHTYCSNMARAGMNPKTLQYLMGHSDIAVTLNVYTHLGLEDASEELRRIQEARRELDRQNGKERIPSIREFRAV